MILRAAELRPGDTFQCHTKKARWQVVTAPVPTTDGRRMVTFLARYCSRPRMAPVLHEFAAEGLFTTVERT